MLNVPRCVSPPPGAAEDGLSGSGGEARAGLRAADHGGGGGVPMEGTRREAGSSVPTADGGVRGSAPRQERTTGQRGECYVLIPHSVCDCCGVPVSVNNTKYNPLRLLHRLVHVEAGLRLPPDVGRPRGGQLPGRDPGAAPGPGPDEDPHHQEVEAPDGDADPRQLPGPAAGRRLLPHGVRRLRRVNIHLQNF